uniref:Syntaxin-binding protein 2 n=1 Tax=Paramormyrops kingsleyae TaxID=1676925 RepID=A0A3B3ST00_9TELE
ECSRSHVPPSPIFFCLLLSSGTSAACLHVSLCVPSCLHASLFFVCLRVCVSACESLCAFVSARLLVSLFFVCLRVCAYAFRYLSVCLSCLCVCLSTCVCVCVFYVCYLSTSVLCLRVAVCVSVFVCLFCLPTFVYLFCIHFICLYMFFVCLSLCGCVRMSVSVCLPVCLSPLSVCVCAWFRPVACPFQKGPERGGGTSLKQERCYPPQPGCPAHVRCRRTWRKRVSSATITRGFPPHPPQLAVPCLRWGGGRKFNLQIRWLIQVPVNRAMRRHVIPQ